MARLSRVSVRLALALALVASVRSATAAPEIKGAGWVSPDALIHVEAARPGLLLDRVLGDGFQGYLKAIPQYRTYVESDNFKKQFAQIQFVATLLDTTPEKGLRDLAGGGLILSVEVVDDKPALILIVTPSDPAFLVKAHKKLVEIARADANGKGQPDPIKTKDYREITGYSVSSEEAHAIVKDALVITNQPNALKLVIDRALDGSKSEVKPSPEVSERREAARADADAVAWAVVRLDKLGAIDKKFAAVDKVDAGAKFLFGPWIERIGKAPWASASIRWAEDALAADVKMPAPRDSYSDVAKRYLPPEGKGAPAFLAPKGVIGNFALWRDLSSIWEVRSEIFPPETVQNLAQLDSFAGQFFGGRDFGTDVLASLGTNWRLVVAEQDFSKISPVPDVKLPAFALVIDLKPGDEDFAQRLRVAFQSFVGLVNLGAAQEKAPPLESRSETVDGVTILTTNYLAPKADKDPAAKKAPVHQRHNFSPSALQVGDTFVLASSAGLARDLVPVLKTPGKPRSETAALEIDGAALGRLVSANRDRLVMQNMLEKGNDKTNAEGEVAILEALLRYLSRASLTASDAQDLLQFRLKIDLGSK